MTSLARWLYVGMAVFSFPLVIAPAKTALLNLAPFHLNQSTSTALIVLISLILGLFIKDLSVVLKQTQILLINFRFRPGLVFSQVSQFAICYPVIFTTATLMKIPQVI